MLNRIVGWWVRVVVVVVVVVRYVSMLFIFLPTDPRRNITFQAQLELEASKEALIVLKSESCNSISTLQACVFSAFSQGNHFSSGAKS